MWAKRDVTRSVSKGDSGRGWDRRGWSPLHGICPPHRRRDAPSTSSGQAFGTAGKVPALPFSSRHHGLAHSHRIDTENESVDLEDDDAFSRGDFDGGNGIPEFSVDEDLSRR